MVLDHAFPVQVSADSEGGLNYGIPGMSMLDYFAGQALMAAGAYAIALGNKFEPERSLADVVARRAYELADAMIAERNRRKEEQSRGKDR